MKEYYTYYDSPIGKLRIVASEKGISQIVLDAIQNPISEEYERKEISIMKEAIRQLQEYFDHKRTTFDLLLNPAGTEFQKKVWNALTTIPYGETKTYKDIAEAIDCPKGFRAVGLSNNKNPIIIVYPCHRVIGSNGKLVGYAGGLDLKEKLLQLENKQLAYDL
ncbi:methylated-DNA-[protein]-cysteine S-methyltransferase [Breznakia sp. PF5-3]|uniref:methylated-DNA--[protein]-cysteine S-methyltransferase n=1 Tax=unclassified Breznakia TaxID=2623764 RepID=UPI00240644BD|nr:MULTISPECIES: methylated-DNA--[protein]-cysteine S-methyltransferase [unclassified Breznakia]MDF9824117.1 methylated-DNA-[protein]-cysteine S-methyltransferase [Breznakia sp. PM6-1]MDF9834915.1 methylated-DNA-[protein]-cysteine S-methyltransferase [Breznakia sp. PF5-3]MDF9837216.1 methylated-DNA-[protein]-cysteine S-methyltransferase [Breznakia sp. PFB2-8]MDF9859206.1 methylated-DNA-[protein]-cysteine S-methyltransferase [Breznakia sp. PH5-24]